MDFDEEMENRRLDRDRYPLLATRQMVGGAWLLSAGIDRTEDASLNYYKKHIGDWARKTSHLTFLEDAAYNRLIDIYYDRESPIPDAEAERLTRAHSAAEKKAVRRVLSEFFHLIDGGWEHGRCEEEIQKLNIVGDASRENGKKGGRPKKETQQVSGNEPNENPLGFEMEPTNNLTPRLQDSKTKSKSQDPAPPARVSDPRKALFDLGVSILGEKKRSLIGKAISEIGETKVAEIIGAMAAKPPVDPGAYFAAATQPKVRGVQC